MIIEEIENKITAYTAICINYGTYSLGYSPEKQIAYEVMSSHREKLLEAIIEYGRKSAAEGFELGEIAASKLSKEELNKELKRIQNGAKNDN